MPEKEISRIQADQVKEWMEEQGGVQMVDDMEYDVWKVGGEALVIQTIVNSGGFYMRLGNREIGGKEHFNLIYTNNQERAGLGQIIGDGLQSGAQTP